MQKNINFDLFPIKMKIRAGQERRALGQEGTPHPISL